MRKLNRLHHFAARLLVLFVAAQMLCAHLSPSYAGVGASQASTSKRRHSVRAAAAYFNLLNLSQSRTSGDYGGSAALAAAPFWGAAQFVCEIVTYAVCPTLIYASKRWLVHCALLL